jgi:hypothetical protein
MSSATGARLRYRDAIAVAGPEILDQEVSIAPSQLRDPLTFNEGRSTAQPAVSTTKVVLIAESINEPLGLAVVGATRRP